jgi:hypothetical protein cdivTM7_00107
MRMVMKSGGEVEKFNYKKLQKSLNKTFLIVKSPEGQSNEFVQKTLLEFAVWQRNKPEITSGDIRRQTADILHKIHPEAAYVYKNFKSII